MPPSGSTSAPLAQPEPTLFSAHVNVAGQSESALQVVAFGVQCLVVDGVHVQSGGSGAGTGGVVLGAHGGVVAGSVGSLPDTPLPAEPAHPHESGSCTHEKPSPQLASVEQGSS